MFDGAMGTSLYEKGNLYTACFEEMNVSRPDVVRQVHQSFVEAGAEVIETNTFGANRYRLARHGFEGKVRAINLAGVQLAREAAGKRAFVVGSVGPTGLMLETLARDSLADVARGLSRAVPRAGRGRCRRASSSRRFASPTSSSSRSRRRASAGEGKVPVIACVSFDEGGTTADGSAPEQVAELLAEWRRRRDRRELRRPGPPVSTRWSTRMRRPACRWSPSRTPACRSRVEAASRTWPRPSTSSCTRGGCSRPASRPSAAAAARRPSTSARSSRAARMVAARQSTHRGTRRRHARGRAPAPTARVAPGVQLVATRRQGRARREARQEVRGLGRGQSAARAVARRLRSRARALLKRGGVDVDQHRGRAARLGAHGQPRAVPAHPGRSRACPR